MLKPIELVAMLSRSSAAPVPGTLGSVLRAHSTMTIASGTLMAKRICQGNTASSMPPTVGPAALAMLVYIAFMPNA